MGGSIIQWSKLHEYLSPIICVPKYDASEATWCKEKKDIYLDVDKKAGSFKDYFTTPESIKFCKAFTAAYDERNGFSNDIPTDDRKKLAAIKDTHTTCNAAIKQHEENQIGNGWFLANVVGLISGLLAFGAFGIFAILKGLAARGKQATTAGVDAPPAGETLSPATTEEPPATAVTPGIEPAATEKMPDVRELLTRFVGMLNGIDSSHEATKKAALNPLEMALGLLSNDDDPREAKTLMEILLQNNEPLNAYRLLVDEHQDKFAGQWLPTTARNVATLVFPGWVSGTSEPVSFYNYNEVLNLAKLSESLQTLVGLLSDSAFSREWTRVISVSMDRIRTINHILRSLFGIAGTVIAQRNASKLEQLRQQVAAIKNLDLSNIRTMLPFIAAAHALDASKKEIEMTIPDTLPDREIPPDIRGNLLFSISAAIEGAIAHAFEGVEGRVKFIAISAKMDGSKLILTISDDGKGLPAGTLTRAQRLAEETGWGIRVISQTQGTTPGTGIVITIDTSRWPESGPQGGSTGSSQGSPPIATGGGGGVPTSGSGDIARQLAEYPDTGEPFDGGGPTWRASDPAALQMTWSAGAAALLGLQTASPVTMAPPVCMMPTMVPAMVR